MPQNLWDVIVIGAGPAGLMAAITCAEGSLKTLVLDGKEAVCAKLLISGGGRCNVTNLKVSENNYQSGDSRIVRNILRAFPSDRTLEFFKNLGVEMTREEGTKFFPKDQSAKTVRNALLKAAQDAGVVLEKGKKVAGVVSDQGHFRVCGNGIDISSKTVVIATGGLSYSDTGSDGSGYALAKSFGHRIVPTTPALTPLVTDDPHWKSLAGITLPVVLTLTEDGKNAASSEGAMLFTHIGFSGPAVLDISGSWLRSPTKKKELWANFLPHKNEADFRNEWLKTVTDHPTWGWKRFLSRYFPERLIEVLLVKSGLSPTSQINNTAKQERENLLHRLRHFSLRVTGSLGYDKAEVTAGGVDLKEVDGKTLESKCCPGIFFAGEILDVDGRIGGYNFQWAWASGVVTGKAILSKLKTSKELGP